MGKCAELSHAQMHVHLTTQAMKTFLPFLSFVALVVGCQSSGSQDELNAVVPLERQQKVYRELRTAMKQAGVEALAAYPKTGTPEGGAEEFRDMQDSLRIAYWTTVCDTNRVEKTYGDSIWTKGVKEKWPAEIDGNG